MTNESIVFTIGHSNHTSERFVELLRQHGVTAVADVRSVPYSRIQPHFNRESLKRMLKEHGIDYVFLGEELGARTNDIACYENGRVQYGRLARTKAFSTGLDRVRSGSENHHIALMCSEREPLECHRMLLIGRELVTVGIHVAHIHADGHVESHTDAVKRLLKHLGMPEQDLFRTPSDMINEAYSRQEARVAYVDQQLVREAREATP